MVEPEEGTLSAWVRLLELDGEVELPAAPAAVTTAVSSAGRGTAEESGGVAGPDVASSSAVTPVSVGRLTTATKRDGVSESLSSLLSLPSSVPVGSSL